MKNSSSVQTISAGAGITLVCIAGVLWGTSGTAQSLGAGSLSPYWVGAAQLVVSSIFYALMRAFVVLRAPSVHPRFLPSPRELGLPMGWIAVAALGIGGYSICFYAGIKLTGVAVGTAVAIGSSPIWAGLIQALLLRTPLSLLWWCGTAVSIAGGVAMALSKSSGEGALSWLGLVLCLLAGLTYACYALVNKRLVARASTDLVNFYVFTGAAIFAVPAAFVCAGVPHFTVPSLLVAAYLGVVVSGIAHALFSSGLRGISGPTGVTLSLIEPVAAFMFAVWIVGEHQPLQSWVGLLAVLAGLLLVIRAELVGARTAVPLSKLVT